jgi:Domain of unknown function (DUF4389)
MTQTLPDARQPYPVQVRADLDGSLSRWLWLVKWLLLVPHLVVLVVLWVGFVLATVYALVAIVISGRYPRAVFDFNVGVLRWSWRVSFYGYSALGTDSYPPFSLGEQPDYPARLTIAYPEHLSRGLALVKWWLLAIPHYLVLAILTGGGTWFVVQLGATEWAWGGSVLGLLVLISAVMLTITGTYPRPLFDLVVGINRWVLRVAAYAALMTDRYPPFRLDVGPNEPHDPTNQADPSRPVEHPTPI